MQIACPKCKTHYQIDPIAIGTNGRSVRCTRCQNVWFVSAFAIVPETRPANTPAAGRAPNPKSDQAVAAFSAELGRPALEPALRPATDQPPAVDTAPAAPPLHDSPTLSAPTTPEEEAVAASADGPSDQPSAMALSDVTIPIEDAPPLVPAPGDGAPGPAIQAEREPGDVESVAARRARAAARRRGLRIPMPLAIGVLGALAAGLLGFHKDVVRHIPQLASFYSAIGLPVNLRGLAFTDLKIGNEIHDGVPVLVVEGMIVSMTSKQVEVPRLRLALRNASGAEIYSWTAQPSQPMLDAFDSIPFRSRLAAPPPEGHDVQVRFFTRRDTIANR